MIAAPIGAVSIVTFAMLVMVSDLCLSFTAVTTFADAANKTNVVRGRTVYNRNCAYCHGHYLQGQPLWEMQDGDYHRRAPALDQTGHAWRRSDRELLSITRHGYFPDAPSPASSTMPGFEATLADEDTVAVVAFIKARWPIGMRVLQAMQNPGAAGMPAESRDADWRLPPDCLHPALVEERRPIP